jgi:hypothetical protein
MVSYLEMKQDYCSTSWGSEHSDDEQEEQEEQEHASARSTQGAK